MPPNSTNLKILATDANIEKIWEEASQNVISLSFNMNFIDLIRSMAPEKAMMTDILI